MDIDHDEVATVLCCLCGVCITPNASNMCINCIQTQVNITEGILTSATIQWCKTCERWLNPPKYWVAAPLESKELLELCIKRIKGLNKVKLVDCSFIWTEPHSRRLKVKLTVQQDIFLNTTVQQSTVVEFTVVNQMCEACQKEQTGQHIWSTIVQARQKTEHKRTFLHLEQLIIQSGLHQECSRVQEQPDGIDFYYSARSHALRMVDFLGSVCPIKWSHSQELISHDSKSNTADIHHAYVVDIAPICKHDLLILPYKFHAAMGGLGPVVICSKINSNIVVMDPTTMQSGTIPANLYWKNPFESIATSRNMIEFYVIDVQIAYNVQPVGKYVLAEVQVQKADEVGNGQEYYTKTHLGGLLQPGDTVMGFMLPELNCNEGPLAKEHKRLRLPEILLVQKGH